MKKPTESLEIIERIQRKFGELEQLLIAMKKEPIPDVQLVKQEMLADLDDMGAEFITDLEDLIKGYQYRFQAAKGGN